MKVVVLVKLKKKHVTLTLTKKVEVLKMSTMVWHILIVNHHLGSSAAGLLEVFCYLTMHRLQTHYCV